MFLGKIEIKNCKNFEVYLRFKVNKGEISTVDVFTGRKIIFIKKDHSLRIWRDSFQFGKIRAD